MIWVVHPGSGSWVFTHPGSRGQKGSGSRIRIHNTACCLESLGEHNLIIFWCPELESNPGPEGLEMSNPGPASNSFRIRVIPVVVIIHQGLSTRSPATVFGMILSFRHFIKSEMDTVPTFNIRCFRKDELKSFLFQSQAVPLPLHFRLFWIQLEMDLAVDDKYG